MNGVGDDEDGHCMVDEVEETLINLVDVVTGETNNIMRLVNKNNKIMICVKWLYFASIMLLLNLPLI